MEYFNNLQLVYVGMRVCVRSFVRAWAHVCLYDASDTGVNIKHTSAEKANLSFISFQSLPPICRKPHVKVHWNLNNNNNNYHHHNELHSTVINTNGSVNIYFIYIYIYIYIILINISISYIKKCLDILHINKVYSSPSQKLLSLHQPIQCQWQLMP